MSERWPLLLEHLCTIKTDSTACMGFVQYVEACSKLFVASEVKIARASSVFLYPSVSYIYIYAKLQLE